MERMKQIFLDRLLTLADFLETELVSRRFDYSRWVDLNWDGSSELLSCNTTACALGWATAIPEFQELGLRLFQAKGRVSTFGVVGLADHPPTNTNEPWATVCHATKEVFGLTEEQTKFLFCPEEMGYPEYTGKLPPEATASQVAAHIRKFVQKQMAT